MWLFCAALRRLANYFYQARYIQMEQTFMKEKPVLPLVLSMSLPMIFSMMVSSLYNIIDSFFVAKISESAMTALSLLFPVQNLINAVTIGFSIGINAVISFYLGAGKQKEADTAATAGLALNALHGAVLTIICIGIMPGFLGMFTSDPEVISFGIRYSRIAFSFSVVIALGMAFEKIYQSVGSMSMTMASVLCGCISNIILDPVFIFGLGPVPRMGIDGAALATGIGQSISLVIYITAYAIKPIHVNLALRRLSLRKDMAARLYSIGIPAILSLALPSLLTSSLNVILSGFSQTYVLVLGAYYKLQTFLYLSANGIIQGMRPLVGYNYGAGEHRRVRSIYKVCLLLASGIMVAGTILCQTVPHRLIGLFTTNSDTVTAGASALRIISAGFIISSVSVVSGGALEGLSMGLPSLIISLLRYVVVTIPAAFVLSRFMGVSGVWHGFWVSETVTAAISYVLVRGKIKGGRDERQKQGRNLARTRPV